MHKIGFSAVSSSAIESALCERIEAIRLSRNITQTALAKQAGVSRSTLTRLARGDTGISLDSFIRILQALDLHTHLEVLLPDPSISPLQRLEKKDKQRQRARPKKAQASEWTWGVTDD